MDELFAFSKNNTHKHGPTLHSWLTSFKLDGVNDVPTARQRLLELVRSLLFI